MHTCRDSVAELVAVSRFAGGDVLLAQGGGGNASVKGPDRRRLWIKASGFRLGEVAEDSGHLTLDLAGLRRSLEDPALLELGPRRAHEESVRLVQGAVEGGGTLRPSLETSFHAMLEDRVVLHTHPVYANAFACMVGGREAAGPILSGLSWVEYATPGLALGLLVARAGRASGRPAAMVLENHGLIAGGPDSGSTIEAHSRIVRAAREYFGELPGGTTGTSPPPPEAEGWAAGLRSALGGGRVVRPARLGGLSTTAEAPPTGGAVVPDDVVCGIHDIRGVDASRSPAAWLADQPGPLPSQVILWMPGRGFLLVGPSERGVAIMEENLLANVAIHTLIARRGRPRYLPAEEIAYLSGMDSERYRQAVAAGPVRS